MTLQAVGPHGQSTSPAAAAWFRRANVVKAMDSTGLLQIAPEHAIRIYRRTFPQQSLDADPQGVANAILDGLGGYRHPKLLAEIFNETPGNETERYIPLWSAVTAILRENGVQTCGPCWATGDYEARDWEALRRANFCGFSAVAVHAYWSTKGPTIWNGLRWRHFWQPGDPPILVTECGRDRVRDGDNGTWLPREHGDAFGPFSESQGSLSPETFLAELEAYDEEIRKDAYVLGATAFTVAPHQDWRDRGFDLDALAETAAHRTAFWVPPKPAPPVVVQPPAPTEPQEVSPMLKRAYLHQFDQLGEQSVKAIAATLRLGGITEIACKTHQHLNWLGNGYDTSPLAFRSLDDVKRRRDEFASEGIHLIAWCVPMGLDVEEEAAFAASVAGELGGLIELDVEPYEGFWEGPKDRLVPFCNALRARGVRYEIDFDARSGGWRPFGPKAFGDACAGAEAVWTQTYWRWFQNQGDGRDTATIVQDALTVLDALGVPAEKRGVIYGHEAPEEYAAVTAQLRAAGVGRVGFWKMGDAGAPVYQAFAAIPGAAAEQPAGDPIDALRDRAWTLANEFERAGYVWHGQGIRAVTALGKGER